MSGVCEHIEAFIASSFMTYLDENFVRDLVISLGGSQLFVKKAQVIVVGGANKQTLGLSWADACLKIFDSHREVCVSAARYWENDLGIIPHFIPANPITTMHKTINAARLHKAACCTPEFSIESMAAALLGDTPHSERGELERMVAEYCVGCATALCCGSYKAFSRGD